MTDILVILLFCHVITVVFSFCIFKYNITQFKQQMNRGGFRLDQQRAKAIGRMLFQKYDISKRGVLEPKQCYQVFSDICYRILNISSPPTMEEAQSMHQILDANRDKRVTEQDFQALAVRYLCGQSNASTRFETRTTTTITVSRQTKQPEKSQRRLTQTARNRLDVVRRLFKMFDKDNSGYLTEQQIPLMLQQTYKDLKQNYTVSKDDVKSYMKMVDKDGDGKVTLEQFEQIVLSSLERAGIKIYQ